MSSVAPWSMSNGIILLVHEFLVQQKRISFIIIFFHSKVENVSLHLPGTLCCRVSHHHTFSDFPKFTKIISKAVCGGERNKKGSG